MSTDLAELRELDALDGVPHPRDTGHLFGHAEAEEAILSALNAGRLHHAWLITGPRGIGKATFAWRAAKFLLTQPVADPDAGASLFGEAEAMDQPSTLDVDPEHPILRRIHAGAESRLFHLRRMHDDKGKPRAIIGVEEVRKLKGFFGMSAADGGRRVVLIDAADEMNPNAANAVLKLLEEPPRDAILLLIAHQPARLLPTIRSRCRVVRLLPLAPADLSSALAQATGEPPSAGEAQALAVLAEGSVGAAVRLQEQGGAALYRDLVTWAGHLPRLDRVGALSLANATIGKEGTQRFELTVTLMTALLSRAARTGALQTALPEAVPGEAAVLGKLAATPALARLWAEAATTLPARARRGMAVNLDPSSLLLDMFHDIADKAAKGGL